MLYQQELRMQGMINIHTAGNASAE